MNHSSPITHSNVDGLLQMIEQYKNEEKNKINEIKKEMTLNSKEYRIKQRSSRLIGQKKYNLKPIRPHGFITSNKVQQYFDPEIERKFIHINKQQLPDYQRLSILSPDRAQKSFRMMHPPTHELKTSRIINKSGYKFQLSENKSDYYKIAQSQKFSSMNQILQDY